MDRALIEKCTKALWCGSTEVALHFVAEDHEKLKPTEEDPDGLNGLTETEPPRIYICDSLSNMKTLEILAHELTHVHNSEHDIEDGVDEEDICLGHGKSWASFWVNNPRFGRWWFSVCVAVRKERQTGSIRKDKK